MKTPIRKSKPMLAIIALLAASVMIPNIPTYAAKGGGRASSNAGNRGLQTVRNATRNNARPDGGDGPLQNINEDWYLEFTPGYINAAGSNLDTFLGATVSIGYKLSLEDRIQLEIGIYSSNNYTGALSYNTNIPIDVDPATGNPITTPATLAGAKNAKATMAPILLSYTYSIRLDSAERWEFRLSPVAGIIAMFDTWNTNATGPYTDVNGAPQTQTEHYSGSDTKEAVALGGGLGITYYFAQRWYADAGYRYLWTAKVGNRLPSNGAPWNGVNAWNGLNAHIYTLTLGWKF